MSTDSTLEKEINRRRTFAIISHPDAGKTTLTEKLLLFGGAINTAGSVKGKANSKYAVSDWMDIEKQRGISVTSSVMQFDYEGFCINILDTPGHQDFSEDTYRTLMAADSAVMVIDASKGVEAQTIKLFKVCALRHIPIFTFINKMDRDAKDFFELTSEIESVLGINTCPINWPIGSGKEFKGIYDRKAKTVRLYRSIATGGAKAAEEKDYDIDDPELKGIIGDELFEKLQDEIELIDEAGNSFDIEEVRAGKLSPVFWGSALNTFGVQIFLDYFLKFTTPPLARMSDEGLIDPVSSPFSGFIFKIQANMNKAHRDRIAFMRICSGRFDAEKDIYHVQSGRKFKLSQPQTIMAQERSVIREAYAGDVIGVFDPGIFSIGDTITVPGRKFAYEGMPTFAPGHFARLTLLDSMKRKQFVKGVTQIAQEGAIQIFQDYTLGLSEIIVGAVGVLQFDVLKYRLENEYKCDIRLETLPFEYIRWIVDPSVDASKLHRMNNVKAVRDMRGNAALLFVNDWMVRLLLEDNEGLELTEFRENKKAVEI
ncbi:MAG: peptide chain release factor 3 [Lachnospiraceae bacterium]|jgi:peptide chain release factor 3|nr:peptide chain release factor 3 [Lachnospiraceae bacterium]MEE3460701.1 peptide chain release factor 3 [Lachnospiraceae bacterium]